VIPGARTALIGLALVALYAAPAGAATVQFGPDLNAHPANSDPSQSCGAGPPNIIFNKPVNGTCMWTYFGGQGSDTMIAPASGTVRQVRVKVGTTTGKMRINVVRFLFRQTGDVAHPFSAGPFLEAYGPEFTPTANSVFAVAANLPMQEDSTPAPNDLQTIQVIDLLALEVEDPTVPIPGFADPGVLSYGAYPGPTQGGVPAPSPNGLPAYSTIGLGVLMNADLDTGQAPPIVTPPSGPTGPTAPTLVPRFTFPANLTAPVTGNAATVPVQCLVTDCTGQLILQSLKPTGARAAKAKTKKPKTVTYGSAKFTAKTGKTVKVKVTLNRAGRALFAHHHKTAKVWAYAKFTTGTGAAKSAHITLKKH
jgi:hypothetical protein